MRPHLLTGSLRAARPTGSQLKQQNHDNNRTEFRLSVQPGLFTSNRLRLLRWF
jgi:hypothetical protein